MSRSRPKVEEVEMSVKSKIVGLGVLALLTLGATVSTAEAQPTRPTVNWQCQRDIQQAELRLEQAIARYGSQSSQAVARRHALQQIRVRCSSRTRYQHGH